MKTATVHEAKTHLSRLLRAVARGDEVVILRRKEPVARLVAVKAKRKRRVLGFGKGLVRMSPDFDAPLPDFAEYEK